MNFKKENILSIGLGILLPSILFLSIIFLNIRPLGYEKTYELDVGQYGDTEGELYIEPSLNLSERKSQDKETYREFYNHIFLNFRPQIPLLDSHIKVSVTGKNLSIISPQLSFDKESINWDRVWDFSKEKPEELSGRAFFFEGCTFFDQKSSLVLPNSEDFFDDRPFSLYVSWKPEADYPFQQIVGNFTWELRQDRDSVTFQIGRMDNASGTMHFVRYPIQQNFFNEKHEAVAIYSPNPENGYIDLYIDNVFAGRTYFGSSKINPNYNEGFGLTFGKSFHTGSTFFKGCLYDARIKEGVVVKEKDNIEFVSKDPHYRFLLLSKGTGTISNVKINVTK